MEHLSINQGILSVHDGDSANFTILDGDVLISIRHEFAEKIYAGEKRYELRKVLPTIPIRTAMWIYEPKPVGMITGFVDYEGCMVLSPFRLWLKHSAELGVTQEQFKAYYKDWYNAYAWILGTSYKLHQPISLAELGLNCPPQSYQRLWPSQMILPR